MNSSTVADSVETHDHLDELRYQEEVKTLTTWGVELFGVAIKFGLHASIGLQIHILPLECKPAQCNLNSFPAAFDNTDAFGVG